MASPLCAGIRCRVVVDEAGELRRQDDGVAVDRQVGVVRVVVEWVGGELDDAGQG
ncbi:hypothetical protein [Streptomyces sp. NPDC088760]|uniref:hypothetical protein n=1 Tax=Streptomyces sp. NPDC088760 TaxID=3365890 RepID=UPI003823C218